MIELAVSGNFSEIEAALPPGASSEIKLLMVAQNDAEPVHVVNREKSRLLAVVQLRTSSLIVMNAIIPVPLG